MTSLDAGHTVIDRYQIQKLLGSGGMASVYLAVDTVTSRQVALKIPHATQQSEKQLKRVVDEYEILRSLAHPAIPKVYALEHDQNGLPLIVMEFVSGETLAKRIETKQLPELSERLRWLKEIASALLHVHQSGILYCDLKPENVLVTKEASQIKILDFGIAVRFEEADTPPSNVAGTTYYKSPEQHRKAPLDVRSDIYSFGLLAFELLTGERPFETGDDVHGDMAATIKISAMHLAAKIPSIRAKNPAVPRDLSAVIELCLEKTPEDRHSTMQEVVECLESCNGSGLLTQVFKALRGRFSN